MTDIITIEYKQPVESPMESILVRCSTDDHDYLSFGFDPYEGDIDIHVKDGNKIANMQMSLETAERVAELLGVFVKQQESDR